MFSLAILAFPTIDPVLLELGPLAIRWYSLAYIAGLVLGWWVIRRLLDEPPHLMDKTALDDLLVWVMLGVIAGGRLGYVLFYQTDYYLSDPLAALRVWEGGMSFHGGMLGSIAAVWLFCRKRGIAFMPVMDVVALVGPIGLGLGRIANFINGELFGRIVDNPANVPWAMIFPGGGPLPRHPSQLYEALGEGLLLFLVLWLAMRLFHARFYPGLLGGLFLSGYAIARITCEFFREPDLHIGFLAGGITMGQLLSLPMLAVGLTIVVWSLRRGATLRPDTEAP